MPVRRQGRWWRFAVIAILPAAAGLFGPGTAVPADEPVLNIYNWADYIDLQLVHEVTRPLKGPSGCQSRRSHASAKKFGFSRLSLPPRHNVDKVPLDHPGVDNRIADITDLGHMHDVMQSYANFDELHPGTGVPGK